MRVLLVEDDALLVETLQRALRQQGHDVDPVRRGHHADAQLRTEQYGLVLLDIGLPDIDGFEILRRMRLRGDSTPVLVITARDAIDDRIYGLDLGADDYLSKPFSVSELEARVRAVSRRVMAAATAGIINVRGLLVDTVAKRLRINGQYVELPAREWALLELFLTRPGRVLPKSQIAESLCRVDATVAANTVEVYVSRLRAKLEAGGVRIRTVRGLGYMWE